jgi:pimeloyl-ACP methyl ester carboxylesterase
MDRRGFGASPVEAAPYSIERDFDDVAAVVDEVTARTGAPVAVWGHSYGANCAMGAATITPGVAHLILYEPSLGITYPPGSIEAIESALAAGNRDQAITRVLKDILDMTDADIEEFRTNPLWPTRLAAAHTIPRECRAESEWTFEPGRFDAITAPSLFIAGADSPPDVAAATAAAATAVPHATVHALPGHGHFAHKTDPALVARIISDFVGHAND